MSTALVLVQSQKPEVAACLREHSDRARVRSAAARRRWGRRCAGALVILLLLVATLSLAPIHEKEAAASEQSCYVGITFAGAGAILISVAPPAGLVYWAGFALFGAEATWTTWDCINASQAGASVGHPCKNMTSNNGKQSYWQSCAGFGAGGGGGGSW